MEKNILIKAALGVYLEKISSLENNNFKELKVPKIKELIKEYDNKIKQKKC